MKSLLIQFLQNKNGCHLGALGHQYWGAMGQCPKVPQPSKLPHQVHLGGTKHFESLLQFDIDLSRLLCLLYCLFQKELK